MSEFQAVNLGNIPVPPGATRRSKRRGLGESSGHGKTSGRGTKGQRARSGPGLRPEFEGGQMPLIRRVPKRGFTHIPRMPIAVVNLEKLEQFPAGSAVDPAFLADHGLSRKTGVLVKILGEGALTHALTVKAHRFSKSALEKIKSVGGTAEVLSN